MDIGTLTGAITIEDQVSGVFETTIHKVKKFASEFEGALGAATVGVGLLTGAVLGAVASIEHLGTKGSIVLGIEAAFERLAEAAGSSSKEMSEALSEGVKNTIDNTTLMQSQMRLLSSGVKVTADDLKLMGTAAREMGKATGTDATHGLSVMSQALLTGRTRGLSMAGILVDIRGAEEKFAASLGVTVNQLNEEGKLQAKRIAILDSTRAYIERIGVSELSFKERIDQAHVAFDEWVESLEKSVASSPHVLGAMDAIGDAIKKAFGGDSEVALKMLIGWINKFADGVAYYGPKIIGFMGDMASGVVEIWEDIKKAWDLVPDWFKNIAKDAAIAGGAVFLVKNALSAATGGSDILSTAASFATITSGLRDFHAVAKGLIPAAITNLNNLKIALEVTYLTGGWAAIWGEMTMGITAFLGSAVGLPLLLATLAGSVYEVVKAVKDFNANWDKGGDSLWGFLTLKDNDTFIRRWLGLSTTIDTVAKKARETMTLGQTAASVGSKISSIGPAGSTPPPAGWQSATPFGPPDMTDDTDTKNYLKGKTDAAEALKKYNDEVKKMVGSMGLGDAITKMKQMEEMWGKLPAAERANITVIQRVMEEYAKLRTETGHTTTALEKQFTQTGTLTNKSGELGREMNKLPQIYGENAAAAQKHFNVMKGLTEGGLIPFIDNTQDMIDVLDLSAPAITTLTSGLTNAEVAAAHAHVRFEKVRNAIHTTTEVLQDSADSWRHLADVTDGGTAAVARFMASMTQAAAIISKDVDDIMTAFADGNIFQQIAAVTKAVVDGIGLMWDALTTSPGEDVMHRVASNFGVKIGEDLGNEIAKSAADTFHGSRATAEIFNLDKIIAAAGGLTNANFDKLLARLRDTFVGLSTGAFTVDQAVTVLDKNFTAFAEHASKGNTLVSNSLIEIIKLADQAGISSKAINDFAKGQATNAAAGLHAVIENIDAVGIHSQTAASGIAGSLFATFDELTRRGLSASEAIRGMAPDIEKLQKELTKAGFEGGAAFNALNSMAELATDKVAGPALDAIHGAAQALVGLHNVGQLNQEMFEGLSLQITDTFNALIKQGVDGSAALALIAPDLQKVWELQTEFGLQVDDSTQKLLDQAIAAGEVGEAHKSAQQKAVDAMNKAADAMIHVGEILEGVFGTAGDAAEDFASRASRAIGNIPTDVNVNVGGDMSAMAMARGGSGRVTGPTMFLAGEAGAESYAFSGANQPMPTADMSGVEDRLDELTDTIQRVLPAAITRAVRGENARG